MFTLKPKLAIIFMKFYYLYILFLQYIFIYSTIIGYIGWCGSFSSTILRSSWTSFLRLCLEHLNRQSSSAWPFDFNCFSLLCFCFRRITLYLSYFSEVETYFSKVLPRVQIRSSPAPAPPVTAAHQYFSFCSSFWLWICWWSEVHFSKWWFNEVEARRRRRCKKFGKEKNRSNMTC